MTLNVLVLIMFLVTLVGCSEPKSKVVAKSEAQPLVEIIDNAQLAKVILRPKQKDLVISRDPFKPIMTINIGIASGSENSQSNGPGGQTVAEDVILIGVAKLGSEIRAFIKTSTKSGVYKVGDKVGIYTLQSIEIDKVVLLAPDNQRIVKVRGKS